MYHPRCWGRRGSDAGNAGAAVAEGRLSLRAEPSVVESAGTQNEPERPGVYTSRYTSTAATNAFQDFRALRSAITEKGDASAVPIFSDADYPYPAEPEELFRLAWPKRRQILARGVLAVSLKAGARDIADDRPLTRDNIQTRQYHHLFPKHLLEVEGRLAGSEINQALNCALITWNTNLDISAKEPIRYLQERTERASGHLGEAAIKERLASHVCPFDELAVGRYEDVVDPDARAEQIRRDFEAFIQARAEALIDPISRLCRGETWP